MLVQADYIFAQDRRNSREIHSTAVGCARLFGKPLPRIEHVIAFAAGDMARSGLQVSLLYAIDGFTGGTLREHGRSVPEAARQQRPLCAASWLLHFKYLFIGRQDLGYLIQHQARERDQPSR